MSTKKRKLAFSEFELVAFIITFSVIVAIWTSIATEILNRHVFVGSMYRNIAVAVIMTIGFMWIATKLGLNVLLLEEEEEVE